METGEAFELLDDLMAEAPLPRSLAHLLGPLLAEELPLDPVSMIAAEVAVDRSAAAFVRIEAADADPGRGDAGGEGVPFRVVSNGHMHGSFWGAGRVVALGGGAMRVDIAWPRPAGMPFKVRSFDVLAAIKDEIVFRFAYQYTKK